MFTITVETLSQWRQHARQLLQRRIAPAHIAWQCGGQTALSFGEPGEDYLSHPVQRQTLKIPARFLQLAEDVACYRDHDRWALLYSVAWRLLYESRDLLDLRIDSQVARLAAMHSSVARDKHKMEAFVRFHRLEGTGNSESSGNSEDANTEAHFVAWFEPEHLIVPAVAPFFVKRFTNMPWSILTPDTCAHWDLEQLTFSQGISRVPLAPDDLETLWLEYYKNIFNPARLKLKAMQSEMPKKYWINLPEAPLIGELTRQAQQRVDTMVNIGYTEKPGKAAASTYVRDRQQRRRKGRAQNGRHP